MKTQTLYPILARVLVLLIGVNAFSYLQADTDLWGHLKFGQDHWQTGALARIDPYSYTAPGHAWINHEWLSEGLYYGIYSAAGSSGLLLFKLGVGLIIFHLLSNLYFARSQNLLAYVLHFFLLTHVLAVGFAMRPHLLTLLFVTVLVVLLHRYFDGHRKVIFWTPLLMLLWVNCHGGVVAGLGLLCLVTAVETVRCLGTRQPVPKELLAALAGSGIAVLVNPYGWDLWLFFLKTIPRERIISEWEPVPLLSLKWIHFKILAGVCLVGLFTHKPAVRGKRR